MPDKNAAQEIADDLLTDPDKDAAKDPPPTSPQTVDAEPGVAAEEAETGPADDHGDER